MQEATSGAAAPSCEGPRRRAGPALQPRGPGQASGAHLAFRSSHILGSQPIPARPGLSSLQRALG